MVLSCNGPYTPPKTKRSRFISFNGGMQGEEHKTPPYDAFAKKHDRMNTMGWLVGRPCLKPCVYGNFLRTMLIWERLVLDGRPRELCDSPTFLNINQRILHHNILGSSSFPIIRPPSIAHRPRLFKTARSIHEYILSSWPLKLHIGTRASALIVKTERGFDFLGYYFGPEGLAIAQKTLYDFVERAIRLYEQRLGDPYGSIRLGEYAKRWVRWAGTSLCLKWTCTRGVVTFIIHRH